MRTLLCAALMLILPLLVYWPTVSHEYGFRDDYAHLREVRERPGWLIELTSSNGRPIYGVVLEASLRGIRDVPDLATLRLASALLIGVVGVLLWRLLRRAGWSPAQSAAIGAAVTLLPGAQIVVGWAIAWPIALGLIAALVGFMLVERGLQRHGLARGVSIASGGAFYLVAGLIYQTSALFAVVPLAAVLLTRAGTTTRGDVYWVAAHLGLLFASLAAGVAAMELVFAEGVVPEAVRMRLEPYPYLKLLWFLRDPLPNSLGLFALRDRFATPASFWVVVAAVVTVIVLGFRYGAKGRHARARWLFAALLLPFVAHCVSLAASSQAIGYRTLLPLSGLFLVLAAFGLWSTAGRWRVPRVAELGTLAALLVVGALAAREHAFRLIAEPHGHEWALVKNAVNNLKLTAHTRVYMIRSSLDHRSTTRVYDDEHGSLTADSDWAAKEIFRAALRHRFPSGLPQGTAYTLVTSVVPPAAPYDLVVDLRKLIRAEPRPKRKAH